LWRRGPLAFEFMDSSDYVRLRLYLLSGSMRDGGWVNRDVTAADLYEYCALSFGLVDFRLVYGLETLKDIASSQPLLEHVGVEVDITVTCSMWAIGGGVAPSLLELVKARRWVAASHMLRSTSHPHQLAQERDSSGDSILAWAAYKATSVTGCYDFIRLMLDLVPKDAHFRNPSSGFLPLHDAAWGNARTEVAVLLCAAFPASTRLRAQGETPYQIGLYHHQQKFAWPPVEELVEKAQHLRSSFQQLSTLAAVRRPLDGSLPTTQATMRDALCNVLGRSLRTNLLVCDFLGEFSAPTLALKKKMREAGSVEVADVALESGVRQAKSCSVARPTPRRRGVRSGCIRRRWPRGSLRAPIVTCGVDEVVHHREATIKERGRCAGAKQVRHRRCGFDEAEEIQVGESRKLFRLERHVVRPVVKEVQRSQKEARWPDKVIWRLDRLRDRADKTFDQRYEE